MKLTIIFKFLIIYHIFLIFYFYKSKTFKIAICTMTKKEILDIKDFVDYYLKLGVDHIFIYGDSEPNAENISNIFNNSYKSYISIYDNIINKAFKNQSQVYNFCYNNNKNIFDWIFMIDIDDYLIINNNTLKNYLSNEAFEKCDFVKIHYVIPTDNDILYYDNRTLLERFQGPFINDTYVKTSFIKGKIKGIAFGIHSPISSRFRNISCHNNGEKYNYTKGLFNEKFDIHYDKAYIIHFKYKSTEELLIKIKEDIDIGLAKLFYQEQQNILFDNKLPLN